MAGTMTRYTPRTNGLTRLPDLMNELFNESWVIPSVFDRAFSGGTARPVLPVNLYETSEGYIFQAALPGFNPEKAEIQVTGREVSIKGSFEVATPENGTWVWHGIPTGEFYESYTLPVEVEGDKVEATYEHGILTLQLPKAEHLRPKTIKVSVKQ